MLELFHWFVLSTIKDINYQLLSMIILVFDYYICIQL